VLAQPGDAGFVDVASPELGDLGLGEIVAECAPRPAAEIEDLLALEAPVGWKHRDDLVATRMPTHLVELHRVLRVLDRAHPVGKLERGCGGSAGHGAPIIGAAR
jgi:hypothetical protein